MIKRLIIGSIVLGTAIGVSKPTFASTNDSPSQFQDRGDAQVQSIPSQWQYLGQTSRELQIKTKDPKVLAFELAKEAPFYEDELVDVCFAILRENVDVVYWTSKEWARFEVGNYEFKHEMKIYRDKERQQLITSIES
ncbi:MULTISPECIES: hypothetical protein [Bacillus cereus group]|uniref:Uncharacterized protein n=1 Tax=Bacillus thuringiensis serovar subtoxicus TaxID=475791 RepID=A0A9X6FGF2_BACTU|nr:hypothetical protein [Bacillus thuringiensis]MEB4843595.1 hypothetical protein [Paenibacillus jamilae]MEB8583506.1 hypothetical protein [Bacillus cereus]MCR6852032.1 hypothetical protein [Bacillus thuringiensis]MDR4284452.1 hypothetical protein [Bacillus thuringiensis]MEB8596977.1 hypothetical protein [Bacillus cereus]